MLIDIILVLILLISVLIGYKKGFIKILAGLISFILAFVLAYMLSGMAAEYIKTTKIGSNIKTTIETSVGDYLNVKQEDKIEIKQEEKSKKIDIINIIEQNAEEKIEQGKASIIEKVTDYVFVGIGFASVFVLVKIVLLIVFFVLQKIFELPVLKSFNKLGGISVQVILTLLKISLVLAVLNFMSPMEFIQGIIAKIDSSVITKILYNHNIIADIILKKVI